MAECYVDELSDVNRWRALAHGAEGPIANRPMHWRRAS